MCCVYAAVYLSTLKPQFSPPVRLIARFVVGVTHEDAVTVLQQNATRRADWVQTAFETKLRSWCVKNVSNNLSAGLATVALVIATSCAGNHRLYSSNHQLFVHMFIPTLYLPERTQPPKLLATTSVKVSEPFDVTHDQGAGSLRGRIERHGGRFHAKLEGNCEGTWNFFEGELELEKPVGSTGGIFSGYIVSGFFVLTTNADCGPFLRRQSVLDKQIAGMK